MRELVRDHAFHLGAVELVDQATRDGDRCVLRITARGERVRRGVIDQIDTRRGDAKSDRKGLDNVPELRLLPRRELARLALREDELVAGEIRRSGRHAGETERGRHHGNAATRREHLADDVAEGDEEAGEHGDERDGAPAVRGDSVVDVEPGLRSGHSG